MDAALGVGLFAAMVAERGLDASLPLGAVIAGAVVVRRRLPLAAFLAGSAALTADVVAFSASQVSPYANLVGLYSLALYGSRRRSWWGPVIVVPAMLTYFAASDATSTTQPVGVLCFWLLTWATGYVAARRRDEQRAARDRERTLAIAEERTRMARELHDLIGHTVTVMLVQAGAARRHVDGDPAQARDLLGGLEETGRQALTELDRMLDLLRADDRPADGAPEPQPGLADVPDLARRMGDAGVRAIVRVDSQLLAVTGSLDLSAYRIVQEALTNVVRHSQANAVQVDVRRTGRALRIEVDDDGVGAPDGYVLGRGLLGIAERVAMFGGTVRHGCSELGGFRLVATIPLPHS
ncbi:histidine kinase [Micromonospora sp. NPDC002296]|uniref:sensor histidine kinase n=1 Tax=Micromonospora sp. NPDC002296 TaxID=3154271 RepID=UPI00331EAF3D